MSKHMQKRLAGGGLVALVIIVLVAIFAWSGGDASDESEFDDRVIDVAELESDELDEVVGSNSGNRPRGGSAGGGGESGSDEQTDEPAAEDEDPAEDPVPPGGQPNPGDFVVVDGLVIKDPDGGDPPPPPPNDDPQPQPCPDGGGGGGGGYGGGYQFKPNCP